MLRVDLARLGRERSVRVEARLAADDPLWEGSDLTLAAPVEVSVRVTSAGSGELVARGRIQAAVRQECRRCLEPVTTALDEEVTLVFAPADLAEEEDGEVRPFDPGAAELDLSGSIREEVVLAVDPFVVCAPECRGLCPHCGANRNKESCDCADDEPDPRWDALRALKSE